MIRSIIKIFSTLFPKMMSDLMHKQLGIHEIKNLKPEEVAVLQKAEKTMMKFKNFDIQIYKWEGGKDKVLLIHGWEGRAGNFAHLIEKLLENNFSVYAFDAPSHGFSSKGSTNLFQFAELTGILIRQFQVSKLISHSFGGVATTYALFKNKDLHIEKYALLTTLDKYLEVMDTMKAQTGMSEEARVLFIRRIEAENNIKADEFNVSDFVKDINVAKALIIHDKDDKVIPIQRSQNVHKNWKVCDLCEIEGTGHFKMLKTDFVMNKTIEFLNS
jgi:pimeloyl-ACP methyl ester carboxylesterase